MLGGRPSANTRRLCFSLAAGALMLATTTCAPAAAPPRESPQPAAAAGTSQASAAPSAPQAAQSWQAEWDKVLAAAKQEGKVVVNSGRSEGARRALTLFEQEYPEIKLEYTGTATPDYFNVVFKEREAGLYLRDLQLNTPDVVAYAAKSRGVFDPVRPALILPEALDDSKWFGGLDGLFYDTEKTYLLSYIASPSMLAHANRDVVSVQARQQTPPRRACLARRDALQPRHERDAAAAGGRACRDDAGA
jgi:hypothetical protein